jgi:hypothetical protein
VFIASGVALLSSGQTQQVGGGDGTLIRQAQPQATVVDGDFGAVYLHLRV